MKTLTLNRKQILYGLLLMTLGFSKSWMQTADASGMREMSLASASGPVREEDRKITVKKKGKKVDINYRVRLENRTKAQSSGAVWENGQLVNKDIAEEVVTVASVVGLNSVDSTTAATILDQVCTQCLGPKELDKNATLLANLVELDKTYATEIQKQINQAEAIERCEKDEDGNVLAESETYVCKAKRIAYDEELDKEAKRDEFQSLIDNLRDRLEDSTSAEERREIMATIRELTSDSDLKTDPALKRQIEALAKAAKSFNTILDDAKKLSQNPKMNYTQKMALLAEIDSAAKPFNLYANQALSHSSDAKASAYSSWSDTIVNTAISAINDPSAIAQKFFEDVDKIVNSTPSAPLAGGGTPDTGVSTGADLYSRPGTGDRQYHPAGQTRIPVFSANNSQYSGYSSNGNRTVPAYAGRPTPGTTRTYAVPGAGATQAPGYGGGYVPQQNMLNGTASPYFQGGGIPQGPTPATRY